MEYVEWKRPGVGVDVERAAPGQAGMRVEVAWGRPRMGVEVETAPGQDGTRVDAAWGRLGVGVKVETVAPGRAEASGRWTGEETGEAGCEWRVEVGETVAFALPPTC